MIDMSIKVQEGKHQQLAHQGLINIILEYALQKLIFPIAWTTFIDMQAEGVIQAIEYDRSHTTSSFIFTFSFSFMVFLLLYIIYIYEISFFTIMSSYNFKIQDCHFFY